MKRFRAKTGLSQTELAMYLHIPRTTLNMTERGSRELDSSSFLLLSRLLARLEELEATAVLPGLSADIRQALQQNQEQSVLLNSSLDKQYKYALQKEEKHLAEMKAEEQRLKRWLIVIDEQLADSSLAASGEWQSGSLLLFKSKALEQLLQCSEPVQAEAALKIARLKASVSELRKIRKARKGQKL
ncbi:MAG: hypothetical protein JWQ27_92 [Ferruginibacter sp.]|nr:hypothetical protein [Ferruginibacter sp.]